MKRNLKLLTFSLCLISIFSSHIYQVNAIGMRITKDDPDIVFPIEQVEVLVNDANKKKVEIDPKTTKQRAAIGEYPTRKGVILVTDDAYKGVIKTGHSAIIYSSTKVVEANEPGVELGPNDWNKSKDQTYAVSVINTTQDQDAKVADWCYNQLGKPYNWNFYRMDYRDQFYCSHLIRAGFLDLYNIDLNTGDFDALGAKAIHPMELVNTSKTSLIYRKK